MGATAMVFSHRSRLSTKNVDAVFVPKLEVYQAVAEVAAAAGMENDWGNVAVKRFFSEKNEILPLWDCPGLKVFVVAPEYLLVMKCMSMRYGRNDTDLADVRFREAAQVLDLFSQYYPEDCIQPQTRFAIEEICQQFSKS